MLQIAINGAMGAMGQMLANAIAAQTDMKVLVGIDREASGRFPYPVVSQFADIDARPDVAIDFSHPTALEGFLTYCMDNHVPAVICTTGHTAQQCAQIGQASAFIPIYYSFNTSLGICLMQNLIQTAANALQGYDIEILEKHHRRKLDAPSGTAIMLANAINEVLPTRRELIYDRHLRSEARPQNEIGMHSIRGGTVVGEHSVFFYGPDEVIEIRHTAFSREVFATGAIRAARFLAAQPPGLYDMHDVLGFGK